VAVFRGSAQIETTMTNACTVCSFDDLIHFIFLTGVALWAYIVIPAAWRDMRADRKDQKAKDR
jgi:hypothetical protein